MVIELRKSEVDAYIILFLCLYLSCPWPRKFASLAPPLLSLPPSFGVHLFEHSTIPSDTGTWLFYSIMTTSYYISMSSL